MPLSAGRFRGPQPDHPERLNKDMRAKHSHTLATDLRAEAHVVELQGAHRPSESRDGVRISCSAAIVSH